MNKLWLWGAGNNLRVVLNYLSPVVRISGIFDNNEMLQGKVIEKKEILKPQKGLVGNEDIVLITIQKYDEVLQNAGEILGIKDGQIIPLWNDEYDADKLLKFFDVIKWERNLHAITKKKLRMCQLELSNQKYELVKEILQNPPQLPEIKSGAEALELVSKEGKSMCRYGDGEFEIIHGRERTKLQKGAAGLQKRLREILVNKEENVVTCIANLYGSLDFFNDEMADVCRRYLTPEVRKDNMSVIDLNKTYYDAYVSRPYIFVRDKSKAGKIFDLWKATWNDRDIVVVEGIMTRCGYKNDLFSNVKSLCRVLCPPTDSWSYYDIILKFIKAEVSKDKLILIALGPTATVLAYDLALLGYQALDIGHLDNEYEWYIRGCEKMEKISYKYMNNMGPEGRMADDIDDKEYVQQIIKKIGC